MAEGRSHLVYAPKEREGVIDNIIIIFSFSSGSQFEFDTERGKERGTPSAADLGKQRRAMNDKQKGIVLALTRWKGRREARNERGVGVDEKVNGE